MAITQETQVTDLINRMIALGGALGSIQADINKALAQWSALGAATKMAQFPTCALTSTGGLGAADANPVAANPINTGVAPGNQLNRAISVNDLTALQAYLTNISSAIGGGAISANAAAATILARTA